MKYNLTIFGLAVAMAVTAASCTRKDAPLTGDLQPGAVPEVEVIRESKFKPAPIQGGAMKAAPMAVREPVEPERREARRATTTRVTPSAAAMKVTLPQGTVLAVRVGETLTSEKNESGDGWTGVLAEPVVVNGLVIAERGAEVTGRVTNVKRAGRVKGVGTIGVTLSRLATADGQRVAINTTSYAAVGKDETKKDVGKVAIASGVGAAIGAIAGRGKGAAIGAGAGAAAGTGVVLATRGGPAVISNEALIRFRIASPVTITEER